MEQFSVPSEADGIHFAVENLIAAIAAPVEEVEEIVDCVNYLRVVSLLPKNRANCNDAFLLVEVIKKKSV